MPKKNTSNAEPGHRNKIYEVLCCLDEPTRRRLLRFLRSPYFVQSKTLEPLCEALLAPARKNAEQGFDRQAVWAALQPGTPYDDVLFRKQCSELLKWTEVFMAEESFRARDTQMPLATLDYVVRHKIGPLNQSALQAARSAIEAKPLRPVEDIHAAYLLERQYYAMMDFDVKVNVRANLEEISHHLDVFYWIEKLKVYSAMLSQQRTAQFEYQLECLPQIRDFLATYPVDSVPELAIYYYSFLTLLEAEQEEHYTKLRGFLDKFGALLPQQEAVELFEAALHYCAGKWNQGKAHFFQEYFDLSEMAIQKGIFLQKNELAAWRFNNMVGSAIRINRLEWAEQFVENYKHLLPPDTRENTYTFNLARIYRYQRKYDRVLRLIQNVEYADVGYYLISKAMLIITYYETNDTDALERLLQTFRVYLNRQKAIPQARRQGYLNLIRYARKLLIVNPLDKKSVAALRQEIEEKKAGIVNYEWLLEKLAEL
jgi:hypothetical protein